ncbi:MAG: LysR substrate-binding domain-containing protein [Candidatus Thiodiazotropha sp.]
MIETIHLRIIAALQRYGTLTEAANALFLTQSALSHQIRHLERRLGIPLWEKAGRRLRLTRAGEQLLDAAGKILPLLEQTERTLEAFAEGRRGILRIGVECYPCYEWLTGVIGSFLAVAPDVEVDIFQQFQFTGIDGLLERRLDLLVTPDRADQPGLRYEALFDYELVLLVAAANPLASSVWVEPEQLAGETLISFPVAQERLDILRYFLWPAGVRPARHKQIESIEIMLRLVSFSRGICALPRWLAERFSESLGLKLLALGRAGIRRSLYAAYRGEDAEIAYLKRFVALGADAPYPSG